MEAKGTTDRDEMKVSFKKPRLDDCDTDEAGAPSSEVVALRHGYNQTYIIRSSTTNLHEVLFRCGNWCYTGKVDLGNSNVELSDLPVVIPVLQKQQGSLQYLCEWKGMPSTSPYSTPLETLYDVFDFIGAELASDRMEIKLVKAAEEYSWVDEDADAKDFFELQSGGHECFDDIDLVASKTFVRGLVLLVIYYQQIKTYRNGVRGFTELRRLSLWKVVNEFLDDDDDSEQPVECISTAQKKKRANPLEADAKQSEERREEGVKSGGADGGDAKVSKSADIQSRKMSLPHHIAPLKATAVSTLKNMPDLGLKAPWDETGKPLGLRTSK